MPRLLNFAFWLVCTLALVLSGLALAARAWLGPFHFLVSVNSPVNTQSIFGLSALLLLLGNATFAGLGNEPVSFSKSWDRPRQLLFPFLFITLLVGSAFWQSLGLPFLSDDFIHVSLVRELGSFFPVHLFTTPGGDGFFRPLGYLSYWLDASWAEASSFRWHFGNLALHILNCLLLYVLARRLSLGRWAALISAIVFGLHGSRPETAWWLAGRFDLLAVLFTLGALLLFSKYLENKNLFCYLATIGFVSLALLSKESSYVLPLLLVLIFGIQRAFSWDGIRHLSPFFLLTLSIFLYRWVLLGGIGGYAAGGQPTIFTFNLLRTAKAFFLRLWSALWFPINWSHEPAPPLALALTAVIIVTVWLLAFRKPANPAIWAIVLVFLAALPVQHLLLIGADMEKSRVLYLPSVGFALLLGAMLQPLPKPSRWTAGAVFAAFYLATLIHNLAIWGRVAVLGEKNCQAVARQLISTNKPLFISNLPHLIDGVYSLSNGFPGCVQWYLPYSSRQLHFRSGTGLTEQEVARGGRYFEWETRSRQLTETASPPASSSGIVLWTEP